MAFCTMSHVIESRDRMLKHPDFADRVPDIIECREGYRIASPNFYWSHSLGRGDSILYRYESNLFCTISQAASRWNRMVQSVSRDGLYKSLYRIPGTLGSLGSTSTRVSLITPLDGYIFIAASTCCVDTPCLAVRYEDMNACVSILLEGVKRYHGVTDDPWYRYGGHSLYNYVLGAARDELFISRGSVSLVNRNYGAGAECPASLVAL